MTLILAVSQGGPPGSVDDIIDPGITRSPSELSCVLRTRESKELTSMTVSSRTQVGIVGAGPAGLLLSHLLDFRDLTGGRWVTIYAQTEIVKDLIAERLAAGAMIEFEVSGTEVGKLDTERPVLRFTDAGGTRHEVVCDAIAGCDGFHGIC